MSDAAPKSKLHARFGREDTCGIWTDFGDGISVKIRRWKSEFVQNYQKRLNRPYADMVRRGPLPAHIAVELMEKLIAYAVIEDWCGATDREGNSLAATDANKLAIIRELPEFRDEVLSISFNAN